MGATIIHKSAYLVGAVLATVHVAFLGCGSSDSADVYRAHPTGRLTFNKHIAPFLFEHCASCHRPGESAPFALLSYEDLTKRSTQIVEVTESRYMPPWLPEPGYGELVGERRLSADQIGMIRQWVEEGMSQGDPADLPPPPRWPTGWQLGEPDLVISLAEPYTLPAEGTDVFRNFVIPIPVKTTRYVKAVELRVGDKRVVHHAVMMVDRMRMTRQLDQQDPGPGFGGMEMGYAEPPGGHYIGWTPGKSPDAAAAGSSWRLDPGTDLVLQLHMLPNGRPQLIEPDVGFFFTETPNTGPPTYLLRLKADKALDIPSGVKDFEVAESITLPVDVEVALVYPHAHYLGKTVQAVASLPDGTTATLFHIKDWDFNWQDSYHYATPVQLPAGTVLTMRWTYDNSADNVRNPNHPPRRVVAGNRSTDEMAHMYLQLLVDDDRALHVLKIAQLRHWLQRYPHDWHALTALSESLRGLGKHQEAIDALRSALERKPDYVSAHYQLALSLESQGKIDEALGHCRQAVGLLPNHFLVRTKLAALLQAKGLLDEAITHLQRAVELNPDYPEPYFNCAKVYVQVGEHELAVANFARAIELRPTFADAYFHRAEAYRALGKVELALNDLDMGVKLKPDDANSHFIRAVVFSKIGKNERALADFRRAIGLKPDFVEAYFHLANTLKRLGRYEDAVTRYNDTLRLRLDYAPAYKNRGVAYGQLGRFQLALSDLDTAIKLNPDDADSYFYRGLAFAQIAKNEQALADYDRAIQLKPDFASAYYRRGIVHKRRKQFELAIRDYTKAIELNPDYPHAHNSLAWLSATCPDERYRDAARAVSSATRACELLGWDHFGALNTLAAAYAEAGKFTEAVQRQTEAVELAPAAAKVDLEARLELYQVGKPYREEGP